MKLRVTDIYGYWISVEESTGHEQSQDKLVYVCCIWWGDRDGNSQDLEAHTTVQCGQTARCRDTEFGVFLLGLVLSLVLLSLFSIPPLKNETFTLWHLTLKAHSIKFSTEYHRSDAFFSSQRKFRTWILRYTGWLRRSELL